MNNPEKWMDEGQIKAYRDFVGARNLNAITIDGKQYSIENGDVDLLQLYEMARGEADRILADGDVASYKVQLNEYNIFFRMMGAEEIPLK